jgi:integrase
MKSRSKKGEVAVIDRDGRLSLRWRWKGERSQISLGLPASESNQQIAKGIALEIEKDLAMGFFNGDTDKYRQRLNLACLLLSSVDLVALFEKYLATLDYCNFRHQAMSSHLRKWKGTITDRETALEFFESLYQSQSANTLNINRSLLISFGKWAVKRKKWDDNYFTDLPRHKVRRNRETRKPFTVDEVDRFLTALATHPHHSHYYNFCLVLFTLGLRPSEAIGLRWKDIDVDRGIVTIGESLVRNPKGKGKRIRKSTKTGTVRTLKVPDYILSIFTTGDRHPLSLVFTSARGCPIDDHNFSHRVWRSICELAEIDYRPPYVARHTCISHLIENGASLVQAAAIAGHSSTRMVAEVYAHMLDQPDLPDFPNRYTPPPQV